MHKLGFLKSYVIVCSIITLSAVFLSGCSSSSNSSSSTASAQSYSGPGSKWDISLAGDGTFNIDHRPAIGTSIDYTIQGTYVRQSSGFITMVVSGGTGTGFPNVGSKAWAIEIPGYAFMLKPVGGDQLVAMVKAGECPTTDFDANWVMVKKEDNGGDAGADASTRDFFGTFHYTFATNTPSLPIQKALTSNFPDVSGGGISAGTCSNGIMTVSEAAMYLTTNGGALVHIGITTPNDSTDDSFIFALSQKAITNVNNLDGNYAGMLFDENSGIGQQINPVTLACTSGSCTGALVSDVETGSLVPGGSAAVELTGSTDAIASGFITGTISYDGSVTGNLACMADIDALGTGKRIISCVGQSPDDNAKMFNVIFVSI